MTLLCPAPSKRTTSPCCNVRQRWIGEVNPSILGSLFERGLDPDKRGQLGAHYTSREMIDRIIEPVVRRPLFVEWESVKASIAALVEPTRRALDVALERASQHTELVEEVREVRTRLLTRSQLELFKDIKKQRRVAQSISCVPTFGGPPSCSTMQRATVKRTIALSVPAARLQSAGPGLRVRETSSISLC